jgi:hypothetical protein
MSSTTNIDQVRSTIISDLPIVLGEQIVDEQQQHLGKCIPMLMKLGTPEALALKIRIQDFLKKTPDTESVASVDGYPCYPDVPHMTKKHANRDWGRVHKPNRKWVLQSKQDGSQYSFALSTPDENGVRTIHAFNKRSRCNSNVLFKKALGALERRAAQFDQTQCCYL